MSTDVPPSLVFLQLPDLQSLLSVTVSVLGDEELRSRQIQTCRELVLLYPDVLASPALDSFSDITVVMTIPFFHKGIVQAFGHRRQLQLGSPQHVFPGDFQRCLSYSLIARLAPSWNKAGLYLISGKDFLTHRGRLDAVSLELSTTKNQLCLSVQVSSVQLPPITLQDFDLPPLVLRRFCGDPDTLLDPSTAGGAIWCHVLPSMKKGQIVSMSRRLPSDGPFRTYRDLQSHWNRLYGYRLPELPEEEVVYCSVHFRPLGERLFTYPLSCIRLQPVQRCPRRDLQAALLCFLSDVRNVLHSVCGLPVHLTSKPSYSTVGLTTAAAVQGLKGEQINLTTSLPLRRVLSQPGPPPPAPPAPSLSRWPSFGSQPPALTCQHLQGGTHEPTDEKRGYDGRMTPSPKSSKDEGSSDFSVRPHRPTSASSHLLLTPASSLTSTTPLLLHQHTQSLSIVSSSVLPPPPPRFIPIFKNKPPLRHVSVAQLRAQKQKEQMGVGSDQMGRVTLPALRTTASAASSSCPSLPDSRVLVRPPLAVPRFNRRLKRPHRSADPQPSDLPRVHHISSLSPASRPKAALILTSKPATTPKQKCNPKTTSTDTQTQSSRNLQEREEPAGGAAEPQTSSGNHTSSKKRVIFNLEKSKTAAEEVEKMARSNQLSRLSSASLSAWLKLRGLHVTTKHRKDELMLKVMSCLAEA